MSAPIMYILVLLAVVVWVAACVRFERRRAHALRAYWSRACQGRPWRRAFPDAPSEAIRTFLQTFTSSYGFGHRRALAFSPTDHVLDVYRALYPSRNWPDALELETFARELKARYNIDLERMWREDLTLGDVFDMTRAA